MTDTKNIRSRGRPRRFDPDQAVATAKQLFHARGFDAVGVAEITSVLGINPPSFYAAFGSKMGLYKRVLGLYAGTEAIPLADILRPDREVGECLASLLEDAARRYAAHSAAPGCLVLEGTRCDDEEARAAARVFHTAAEGVIRSYIAARHPEEAERLADFVSSTMVGLSAMARIGRDIERLLSIARVAGGAVKQELSEV
ncbi:putative transcriptional regulator [Agrobacterium fabacearum S56]|uniref:TetR/AcrR family transcriptional regulator n=1 Tax=Agrobacterium TaxID=357 RepID=UPI00036364D9|nr:MULTISPECIES: TetR/AcrR family transcriptional regulator [Agrobacterium]CUX04919.1 putative transcriptional regulator [Agrobacterium fabacearum S56]